MRTSNTLMNAVATTALLAAAVGCQKKTVQVVEPSPDERTLNTMIVHADFEQDARNAIVAQRTIYAYHFAPASAALNDLGQRQVQVLADSFPAEPVQINVTRGDASAELYARRVESVRARFLEEGVDPAKLTLLEGIPSGPGISSEQIWSAYQSNQAASSSSSSSSSSGSPSGSSWMNGDARSSSAKTSSGSSNGRSR